MLHKHGDHLLRLYTHIKLVEQQGKQVRRVVSVSKVSSSVLSTKRKLEVWVTLMSPPVTMLGTKPVRSRPSEAATRSREFQVWWGCINKSVFRNVPLSHKQLVTFFVLVPGSSVTAILRKLKQQSRESVEDKRPKLLKALREVRITLPHYAASQNVAVFSESPQAAVCIALSLRTHQSSEILDVKPSRACTVLRSVNFYECLNRRVCPLCSLVTFIWSCTGIFRAGVSCH